MLRSRVSERFQLPVSIEATAGRLPIQLVDVSGTGFKVHHREQLPPKGESFELRFRWNGAPIALTCSTVWTTIHRLARSTSERPTFSSGIRIESMQPFMQRQFDAMIEALIRNREEVAAPVPAPPRGGPYLFCELLDGKWQQRRTFTRDQPGEGFTLSANEDAGQIARLCAAYAGGDGDTRKLIRTLAALSLKSQGDEAASA